MVTLPDVMSDVHIWGSKVISKDDALVELVRQMAKDCSPEIHERLNLAQIPDVKSRVLAGAGHLPPFEQPLTVSKAAQIWLLKGSLL